ncbi:hypothetical protein KN815_06995 [Streptomyces sp. 4503]|uniref:Ankyrin repeat domain-containing protein n=1 Tax=Streptomyces niphimycinicus TaxID=2842201 RepID=A0ABS6CAC8_9ACTN|nr:hypothetical protein [Streptomyces niphimycinicus]MBU3863838.1 hypothetical protein [Streptomyces niphimycinicus]
MRSSGAVVTLAALLLGGLAAAPAPRSADPAGDGLSVWAAQVTKDQIPLLLRAGADGTELGRQVPEKGTGPVELYSPPSRPPHCAARACGSPRRRSPHRPATD